MRRPPRRRRAGAGRPAVGIVVLVIGFVVLSGGIGFPSTSYSTATADRPAQADVVEDRESALALNVTERVQLGETERLVDVTNRLETSVTVTVRLREDSTDKGDLVVSGANEGSEASFVLGSHEHQRVEIDVTDDDAHVDEKIYFHATASGSNVYVSAPDRHATIEDSGGL